VRKAAGSLCGLAYGDSFGKPTEFQTYETILATYGSPGPRALTGHPALVTDDTQMALVEFIASGWDETDAALARVEAALAAGSFEGDPCVATREGWIVEGPGHGPVPLLDLT
jgi:ADP-ribosylglycohydrolase